MTHWFIATDSLLCVFLGPQHPRKTTISGFDLRHHLPNWSNATNSARSVDSALKIPRIASLVAMFCKRLPRSQGNCCAIRESKDSDMLTGGPLIIVESIDVFKVSREVKLCDFPRAEIRRYSIASEITVPSLAATCSARHFPRNGNIQR